MSYGPFRAVWCVDTEFYAPDGERPKPICAVAWNLCNGEKRRLWCWEKPCSPIYETGFDSLFVAYFATAEIGFYLASGWPIPKWILDLYVEFRNLTNGLPTKAGSGLIGALVENGLDATGACVKEEMREKAMRGGPFTKAEEIEFLGYCERDVESLSQLFQVTWPQIAATPKMLGRALHRGRCMAATAHVEWNGIPVNVEELTVIRDGLPSIKGQMIQEVDKAYGVYDGLVFKQNRFEDYLCREKIPWKRLESGGLDLEEETFIEIGKTHSQVKNLGYLRHELSELRLNKLTIGQDGRNRCLLSPFRARSSRYAPSTSKFMFGPSPWIRSLIQPPPGYGIAHFDYEQQEFGIAAALSQDRAMMEAYRSGDPYLAFAVAAGAIPPGATKKTCDPDIRERYKRCSLGVAYGMEEASLAKYIDRPIIEARELLRSHHEIYRQYWAWSDNSLDRVMLYGWQATVFGWTQRYCAKPCRCLPRRQNC